MIKLTDILLEIGDATSSKYPWKLIYNEKDIYAPDGYREYEFSTESDLTYGVQITNISNYLDIDFVADGSYDEVNKGELFKVMATITDIILSIIKKGNILGIRYNPKAKGSDFGQKRDKLYKVYINKIMPGTNFYQQDGTIIGVFPKNNML